MGTNVAAYAALVLFALLSACSGGEAEDAMDKYEPTASDDVATVSPEQKAALPNAGFIHGFVASLSVIIVSELGDKTFFIAAIMAMRHARFTVLTGAVSALGLMTVMSTTLGYATTIIPRAYTYYGSSLLFALFGLKMLKEGYYMAADEGQEELEEVSEELKKKETELSSRPDVEGGGGTVEPSSLKWARMLKVVSPVWIQAFTLTFLAEWGDRSQLATIILAAREDPIGVTTGGTLGHLFCTGLAVVGGRLVAQKISVRTVTLIGAVVFLLFAASALLIGPG
ncbi:putative divalent cation/proton antiporter TMEM165 [Sycon ciliatum]|uniref:putative divalent cation/proton antiporter TMEM165 n=1 Tax=Sycon ciliatum TaxID=27933 RepID=UPI0020A9F75D|eukprot:scpid69336/ scgid11906/ Transmembrane protein 165; Transmembrane protein PT27; Transmembrane protein TPARL